MKCPLKQPRPGILPLTKAIGMVISRRGSVDCTENMAHKLHKVQPHRGKILRIAPVYENSD